MKKTKTFLAAGSILTAALALTACGGNSSSSSSNKKELNWEESAEIPTMDLSKATDSASFTQLINTMEGLYRAKSDGSQEKAMATSEKVSKDGKTYTFTLRKDNKWSNGDPVTAQDFVYSWRRTVDPKTASQYAYLFEGIKNATDIQNGKKKPETLGIKAVGKYKLVVTLDRRIPYFNNLMAFGSFFPQNEKAVKKYGSKYGTASKYMVYNGPYIMSGWSGSSLSWKLKKNPYYWDKKNVKLTKINFSVQKSQSTSYNLYQVGKLDMTTLSASQSKSLKNQKGWQIKKSNRTQYLMYNFKTDKNLRNVNLRGAIAAAINKESLAKTLNLADIAATSLTPSGVTDPVTGKEFSKEVVTKRTKAIQSGTKAQAKAYYKKALKELGKKQIIIKLLGDDTDDAKKATEFIQSALESTLGMKVEVTNMPFKNRFAREEAGDFDVILDGWSGDYADPNTFLEMFQKTNVNNYGSWENAAYNKAMETSKTTTSSKKRWAELVKAERILLTQQGVTPLYYGNTATLINPKVKNITLKGAGLAYNFKGAYISK